MLLRFVSSLSTYSLPFVFFVFIIAVIIAHSLVRLLSYQATEKRGTWQRVAENGINETNEVRHGRRYRTNQSPHLFFRPTPSCGFSLLRRPSNVPPPPEAGDERAAMMIAWRAWR